jgi:putative ABC transport system substrate-binding protein
MNRRDTLPALLGLAASGVPLRGFGQARAGGKPYRISLIPDLVPATSKVFLDTLRESGRVEGRDFVLLRSGMAYGPAWEILVKRVIEDKPDLILAGNTSVGRDFQQSIPNTPVVLWGGGFPVEGGLADSLARPGRNVTGVSAYADLAYFGKLVQLLRDAKPGIQRVGVIWGQLPPQFPRHEIEHALVQFRDAGRHLKLDLRIFEAPTPEDIDLAMAKVGTEGIEALVLPISRAFVVRNQQVLTFAIQKRLPTITDILYTVVEAKPLLSYGPPFEQLARQAAGYVERILWRGDKPGDLPIQLPTRFEFTVNLKTAKAIGIKLPQSLMVFADRVVE